MKKITHHFFKRVCTGSTGAPSLVEKAQKHKSLSEAGWNKSMDDWIFAKPEGDFTPLDLEEIRRDRAGVKAEIIAFKNNNYTQHGESTLPMTGHKPFSRPKCVLELHGRRIITLPRFIFDIIPEVKEVKLGYDCGIANLPENAFPGIKITINPS